MIDKWRDVLQADKAAPRVAADSVDELKIHTEATTLQFSALSSYLIYEISGEDAQSFLQGQFCNDLAQVSSKQAQITGYCTPKGRLLALPLITGFDGGYRLLVPAGIADAFIKRLSMFVMRSKVTIKPLEDWAAVGITAPVSSSPDELSALLGPVPEVPMSVNSSEAAQLIRWHDDHSGPTARSRYLRLGTLESQHELWTGAQHAGKSSDNTWRLGDISAGIPNITEGVLEAFVPQMINLQLIDGLSFKKGCYPGQEIVARMQYLGKLKRHMRVFSMKFDSGSIDINDSLKPGAVLASGADENAGIVVDALPTSSDSALVLAVTKVKSNDDPFMLSNVALTPAEMPYELPSVEVA